jgi:hypothetical protein
MFANDDAFFSRNSNNCLSAKRPCEYTPAKIPLRERRAQERQPLQPGEQKPWVCWEEQSCSSSGMIATVSAPPSPIPWEAMSESTTLDPFNTMVINMQYKSKELFNYCEFTLDIINLLHFASFEQKEGKYVPPWASSLSVSLRSLDSEN